MQNSGYSGTPLIKKLGILPSSKLLLLNAPSEYFELVGVDLTFTVVKSGREADLVHLFVVERKDLEKQFLKLIKGLPSTTVVWISWYKKSAKIPTDITEDIIREIVLPTGWVDVKVCAVSEVWSGLKIVRRKELR
jgi:hypothetical protein